MELYFSPPSNLLLRTILTSLSSPQLATLEAANKVLMSEKIQLSSQLKHMEEQYKNAQVHHATFHTLHLHYVG